MQTLRILLILLLLAAGGVAYAVWGHGGRQTAAARTVAPLQIPLAELTALQPVTSIELEPHPPDMPPGLGHDEFVTDCVICHSPRYVLNQPVFPRKTWTAEVRKMVKAYGAPIPASDEKSLVDYLVAWHGMEDPPPAPAAK